MKHKSAASAGNLIQKSFMRIRRKINSRAIVLISEWSRNIKTSGISYIYYDPQPPQNSNYLMWKISRILKFKTVDQSEKADIIFSFNEDTKSSAGSASDSEKFHINLNCTDISKDKVSEIFERVFGYDLLVDPTKHKGYCVAKSNRNAAHDGRVILCPINVREPDTCYQRVVDNEEDGYAIDFRVSIVKGEIPLIYIKKRPMIDRFSNSNDCVTMKSPQEVVSHSESQKILKFCDEINLDFGEIDVLRDLTNKKIYIVDVNKTPYGPPSELSLRSSYTACTLISLAFQRQFIGEKFAA